MTIGDSVQILIETRDIKKPVSMCTVGMYGTIQEKEDYGIAGPYATVQLDNGCTFIYHESKLNILPKPEEFKWGEEVEC